MAARIGRSSNLTLIYCREYLFEQNRRTFSTTKFCSGNTWIIRSKSKREKILYEAPKYVQVEKTSKKNEVQTINIPQKIKRSPTAILEALASTVRNDVNQPIYVTIDDPYLYATTDRTKKAHLAAYESGRRTAEHMLALYPDYFTQIWEDPLPNAWKEDGGYIHTELSEESLEERISKRKVADAIDMYRQIVSKGTSLSQKSQEKLLELLVVFNCKDPEQESDISSFINAPGYKTFAPFPPNTWKKNNAAEEVFNALPEQTAFAYCQMIRGMAANYHKEGVMNMFNAMKATQMPVDLETYNSILRVASLDTETMDDVKLFIETILKDMAANGVEPNERTFVSAMVNCRRLSRWSGSKKFVLSLLSEMKACGIDPGLSTYVEIVQIFFYFKDKVPKTQEMFEQIIDNLKGKEFECKSENDVQFFRSAMGTIAAHFPDSKLALKVHEIMQYGQNRDLLTNRQSQYAYYSDLFSVITPLEPIDTVMELYKEVVPYIFFPSSEVFKLILESIEMHDSYHYIPTIYSDIQWTSMFKDFDFLSRFTQTLAQKKLEPKLQSEICMIASSLMQTWATKQHLPDALPVNGVIIGHFIIAHLNNNDPKTSWSLFETYRNNRRMRGADPNEQSLALLTGQIIEAQDYVSAKEILNVMSILDYDISTLVDKALQSMSLSDMERNYLQGLLSSSMSSSSSSDSSDSD
ncbi:pentatricopeptide repeat domain-containing protein 3, mitochondrial [Plakobranchus ocellatus]|uniref:Pentatricopeptide repeat domain-containing protein 3, mitochondrial n=1 Tax=Plakobranchus ocellatus TaxID=259542 RepID=A0AAV4BKT5_9GAST|nr:pentatricopeptide repeat domain-containing protein 3, mitochondrial [Plakobranchus ocellatus]